MYTSDVVDWRLIPQVAVAVTAAMQLLKMKKPFNAIDGEYLAMATGVLIAMYFYFVDPTAPVVWNEVMRVAASGLVAGVIASGAYNVQKALPVPNIIPTRSEKQEEETLQP